MSIYSSGHLAIGDSDNFSLRIVW
ncbi:MAG: hypothetical protein INH41_29545 [Myxococcaceae bacterium]|nr:hypothetical protein [Myxococcaceae bacterium]MCA3016547.1 hypothetical protein [Myxococcaceae bacterium]